MQIYLTMKNSSAWLVSVHTAQLLTVGNRKQMREREKEREKDCTDKEFIKKIL